MTLSFMVECFKCGVSGDKARLFDAISDEGIVKICEKCSFGEDMPIIRRPTTFQLKETEKKKTVYEKLAGRQGINVQQHQEAISSAKTKELLDKQEISLRDIVDRNFQMNLPEKSRSNPNLVDNFHWLIMRARRKRKLTHSQFARELAESVTAIKMAEQGILPEDDYKLLSKIESFLGIKLIKREIVERTIKEQPKRLGFDADTSKTLTISDLKEMKQEHEAEIFKENPKIFGEKKKGISLSFSDQEISFPLKKEIIEEEPEFIQEEIIEEKDQTNDFENTK